MIQLIQDKLQSVLKDQKENLSGEIRFLKYNTSISGTGLGNKVLFFAFHQNDKTPFAVVKSVRSYRDALVIQKGSENLKVLNEITKDTEFFSMFPQSLFLFNDGHEIYNAETICSGRKAELTNDIKDILRAYTSFSKHLLTFSHRTILLNFDYGKKIIADLDGSSDSIQGLLEYLAKLWGADSLTVPGVLQHGDFTIDNIMIDQGRVRVIDCDTFGNIDLPGYDLFHLLARKRAPMLKASLLRYFTDLGISYIPDSKLFFLYYLHELYIKRDYILKHKTLQEIISEFETFVV